jgi:hypothetical protein
MDRFDELVDVPVSVLRAKIVEFANRVGLIAVPDCPLGIRHENLKQFFKFRWI